MQWVHCPNFRVTICAQRFLNESFHQNWKCRQKTNRNLWKVSHNQHLLLFIFGIGLFYKIAVWNFISPNCVKKNPEFTLCFGTLVTTLTEHQCDKRLGLWNYFVFGFWILQLYSCTYDWLLHMCYFRSIFTPHASFQPRICLHCLHSTTVESFNCHINNYAARNITITSGCQLQPESSIVHVLYSTILWIYCSNNTPYFWYKFI